MTRLALVLLLAACSGKPDRVVGKWQSDTGKGPIFELRADGSLDMEPDVMQQCDDDKPAIDACRAKQRWSRSGNTVTLRKGGVWHKQTGLYTEPGPDCKCVLESHELTLDADTLTAETMRGRKERAVRVR